MGKNNFSKLYFHYIKAKQKVNLPCKYNFLLSDFTRKILFSKKVHVTIFKLLEFVLIKELKIVTK